MMRAVSARLALTCMLASMLAVPAGAMAAGPGSTFPANPASGTGRFAFDLEMQIEIKSDKVNGPATVYVNSRDGSMALANPHTTLWALGMPDVPDIQIHHAIFRRGRWLVCGKHPDQGEVCAELGNNTSPLTLLRISEADAEDYFASVRMTQQLTAPVDVEGTRGLDYVHGLIANLTYLTVWFDPGRSTIATRQPALGPGVGVMRDLRSGINRTVRHVFFDFNQAEANPLNWLSIHLNSLRRTQHSFDTSRYRLITIFSHPTIDSARDLSNWMKTQGRQIRALHRQMEECPDGQAGNDCRDRYRAQIKTLEDTMRARVMQYGRSQGLQIPD